jgi:hypothetical protein
MSRAGASYFFTSSGSFAKSPCCGSMTSQPFRHSYRFITVVNVEIRTSRTRRTWVEKAMLWPRAYQTRIFDQHREIVGRGPTPEASREDAKRRWITELSAESKSFAD